MLAAVWASPIVIDGKVYLGDEDGDVVVLAAGKEKKVLAENNLGSSVYSSAGARQRRAVHHEPQPALVAVRGRRGADRAVTPFELESRTRLVFGPGTLSRLGELARELGFRRTLLVSDPGIVATGFAARAQASLEAAGIAVTTFSAFDHDPTSAMADAGAAAARAAGIDSLVGLGGGSSMDCAKSIGFLLTNGGHMPDYRGYAQGEAAAAADDRRADHGRHRQRGAGLRARLGRPRPTRRWPAAIPRPRSASRSWTRSCCSRCRARSRPPPATTRSPTAVETWVTTARTPASDLYAREAFRLLESAYERVLAAPADLEARGATLLGAHWAGAAISASMLGATHACANPLTARYGTMHGVAIALLLPHVVRWNAGVAGARYAELLAATGRSRARGRGRRRAGGAARGAGRRGRPAARSARRRRAGGRPAASSPTRRRSSGPAATTRGRSTPTGARELYRAAFA